MFIGKRMEMPMPPSVRYQMGEVIIYVWLNSGKTTARVVYPQGSPTSPPIRLPRLDLKAELLKELKNERR